MRIGPIDLDEEPVGSVGPAGQTRLMRQAGQLVQSINGAAPTAVGSATTGDSDPWLRTALDFIRTKVSTLTNVAFRTKFAQGFNLEIERNAVSGTGATATIDITRNGGVLDLASGTTGGSFQIVRNRDGTAGAGTKADLVANCRTQKWAVLARVALDAMTSGCEYRVCQVSTEGANGDHFLGVVGGTSTANWTIKVGSAAAVDSGVALPAAGTFVTVALIADGTNISAWNVDTGVQIGSNQAQSAASTAAGHFVVLGTNSAAVNKHAYLDDAAVVTEPAA